MSTSLFFRVEELVLIKLTGVIDMVNKTKIKRERGVYEEGGREGEKKKSHVTDSVSRALCVCTYVCIRVCV